VDKPEMLTVYDYLDIRSAHARGESVRSIAKRLRHAQKTIRKVIACPSGQPPGYRRSQPTECPKLGAVIPVIEQILKDDEQAPRKQRHTAMRLFQRLVKEHQYTGGYDQVRRYVAQIRHRERETFVPLEHRPGVRLECDFGHIHVDYPDGRRLVSVLVACWSFSQGLFLMKLPNERTESVLHGLVCALGFFDLAPRELWWDNPKTVAWAIHRGRQRLLNAHFAALASHYRFAPLFCMPAKGQEKPDAERSVYALQRRFGTPVPQVANDQELNAYLLAFCRAEMDRTVAGQPNTIGQNFALEKPRGLALPQHPFDACVTRAAVVDKYQTVRVDGCRYSVPREVAFRPVTVKLYPQRVEVVHQGRVVASHTRLESSGASSLDPLHYLPTLLRKPATLDHSGVFGNWELPPCFETLRATREQVHGERAGTRHYIRVLQLLLRHPVARVQQAIDACGHRPTLSAELIAQKVQRLAQATATPASGTEIGQEAGPLLVPNVTVAPPDLRRFDELLSLPCPSTEPVAQGDSDVQSPPDAAEAQPEGAAAADNAGGVRQAGA
jgi:transposase